MRKTVFEIEGMSCEHCVRQVTQALGRLGGVRIERVAVGTAEVAIDDTRTSPSAVALAITAAGYPARQRDAGPATAAERLACRTPPGRAGDSYCCGG